MIETPLYKKSTFSLMTTDGKPLMNGNLNSNSLIDISSLENGMYILQLSTKEAQFYQKIIKN
jgi:hypothetical protein